MASIITTDFFFANKIWPFVQWMIKKNSSHQELKNKFKSARAAWKEPWATFSLLWLREAHDLKKWSGKCTLLDMTGAVSAFSCLWLHLKEVCEAPGHFLASIKQIIDSKWSLLAYLPHFQWKQLIDAGLKWMCKRSLAIITAVLARQPLHTSWFEKGICAFRSWQWKECSMTCMFFEKKKSL